MSCVTACPMLPSLELVTRCERCTLRSVSGVRSHSRQKCGLCSNFHAICNYLLAIMDAREGEEVRRESGSSRAGNRADNLGISNSGLLSTTCQKHGAMGIMLYFISGPRPRILIIRICYHCSNTIIGYDSCVKPCYGHNGQNVWIILHYVIWTDFITPNMEVLGAPGQEPFV